MKIAPIAEIKAHLSAYVKESEKGPIVVTKNGRPVAMLVAVSNEDELERLILAHSPKLREILDAAEQRIQEGEGIAHEDFWREVEET